MSTRTAPINGSKLTRAVRLGIGAAAAATALMVVPAAASANASCVYNPSTKVMTVTPGTSDLRLFRGADGSIQSELLGQGFSLPCFQPGNFDSFATVLNTDTVEIANNEGKGNRLIIDQSQGSFAPGATIAGTDPDPRVEIVDKTFGWAAIELIGTGANELIQVGQLGFRFDALGETAVRFGAPNPLGNMDQGSDMGLDFRSNATNSLIVVDGGGGNDTITGRGAPFPQSPGAQFHKLRLRGGEGNDFLQAGNSGPRVGTSPAPQADELNGGPGDDTLWADNNHVSNLVRGGTGNDAARIDTGDNPFPDLETVDRVPSVGRLTLTPRKLRSRVGQPARMALSWTHPKSWRDLREVELLVTDSAGERVGRVTVRPKGERVSAHGALAASRDTARVTHKGKTVRVELALRLARSAAGKDLAVHVRAANRSGRTQLERSAGLIQVSR